MAWLDLDDCERRGWERVGASSYRHHCGAYVTQLGKTWTARTTGKVSFSGFPTAIDSALFLEASDVDFWSYGRWLMEGDFGGIESKVGCFEESSTIRFFVLYLDSQLEFPEYLTGVFEKNVFNHVQCAKCLSPMAGLSWRSLRRFDGTSSKVSSYIVCACSYPVWQSDKKYLSMVMLLMDKAKRYWRRRNRIEKAGGSHKSREIDRIISLQQNRCFYCNARFTDQRPWTKDHLLAVAEGGGNWAINIVIACRSCNSRRGDMPFRTYCKLLSAQQNQRIRKHLKARSRDQDFSTLSVDEQVCFSLALAHHDPNHWRFQNIQRCAPTALLNALSNRLLPGTPKQIIRLKLTT